MSKFMQSQLFSNNALESATLPNAAFAGFIGLLLVIPVFAIPGLDTINATVWAMVSCSLPALLVDVRVNRVHRRATTGLNWDTRYAFSLSRVVLKLLGLSGTVGVLWVAVLVFPEYHGGFYQPVYTLVSRFGLYASVLAVIYVGFVDRRMIEPCDSLYHAGLFFIGKWVGLPWRVLGGYLQATLVKAFFFPLMFVWLSEKLREMPAISLRMTSGFVPAVDALLHLLYFIDLAIAAPAYLLTLRLFDGHVRSVEPSGTGWMVALLCYQPFWSVMDRGYLGYGDGFRWDNWLASHPSLMYLWGGCIVILTAIYTWATLAFGYRFSNLTHRGIITSGPYSFMKHPAYISKNLSWWFVEVPWINPDPIMAITNSIKLTLINLIYFFRAKTEERHLSFDPTYRAYLAGIQK